ncbi:MAG TPA: beta-phosphoglucomutase [Ktedonobacteraceae bacterium]|jgi:beta-phosphoglucomutase|nr:beta-phosphoglucomutase [Ktedonobacteraceae bacterium]
MQKPKAIIFDLDGVLTDTSEYHYKAWKRLADDEGIPFTKEENDKYLRGVARRESLMYIIRGRTYSEAQIQEMMDRKNRYYIEMVESMTPKDLVAGGRELLGEIRDAGIKVAIASASKNCRTVLKLLDIISYMDGIADGNSVVNSKPAPDIFVYAAGLVQINTPDCLGVEDADAGIEAIKTAGMQALGIGPKERFHRADKVLPTLASLHLADVLN